MRNYEIVYADRAGREQRTVRKGLKKINIGEDVWLIGKQSYVQGKLHSVIYGPDNKEYHVWDKELKDMCMEYNEYGDFLYSNLRHGNGAVHSKVKIYILTHILDYSRNWCFDLTKIPPPGRLKIIYHNGTIKIIDNFEGVFEEQELISKRYTWSNNKGTHGYVGVHKTMVKPVGYRVRL